MARGMSEDLPKDLSAAGGPSGGTVIPLRQPAPPDRRLVLLDAMKRASDELKDYRIESIDRAERVLKDAITPAHVGLPAVSIAEQWKTMRELGGEDWLDVEPPAQTWLLKRGDKPVLARGVVGMLIAPGGTGKTQSLVQLAISVATALPWLATFDVATPGRVVLLLAEEDIREVRRRLYYAAKAMRLEQWERDDALDRIVPMGFAGHDVAFIRVVRDQVVRTERHAEVLAKLNEHEHALVLLDPLARIAPGCESDNAGATGTVEALEALAHAKGEPTVIVAHHSSKGSRRPGADGKPEEADASQARGVTALTDGVRWVCNLSGKLDKDLKCSITKSNGAPKGEPVPLERDDSGVLRARDVAQEEAREEAQSERDAEERASREEAKVERLCVEIEKRLATVKGLVTSKSQIVALVKCNKQLGLRAVDTLINEGRIHRVRRDGPDSKSPLVFKVVGPGDVSRHDDSELFDEGAE